MRRAPRPHRRLVGVGLGLQCGRCRLGVGRGRQGAGVQGVWEGGGREARGTRGWRQGRLDARPGRKARDHLPAAPSPPPCDCPQHRPSSLPLPWGTHTTADPYAPWVLGTPLGSCLQGPPRPPRGLGKGARAPPPGVLWAHPQAWVGGASAGLSGGGSVLKVLQQTSLRISPSRVGLAPPLAQRAAPCPRHTLRGAPGCWQSGGQAAAEPAASEARAAHVLLGGGGSAGGEGPRNVSGR